MNVDTRFDVGDTVYFRTGENQFAKGKVLKIEIVIPGEKIEYEIKNPFFDKKFYRDNYYFSFMCDRPREDISLQTIEREENFIFRTEEEVREHIASIFIEKIQNIKERKK